MKRYLTYKIGIINNLLILAMAGCMAFLGMLSLMNMEQGNELKKHLVAFFFSRYALLLILGLVPVAALVMLNVLAQIIATRTVNGTFIVVLFLRAYLAVALAALAGHGFLCLNL